MGCTGYLIRPGLLYSGCQTVLSAANTVPRSLAHRVILLKLDIHQETTRHPLMPAGAGLPFAVRGADRAGTRPHSRAAFRLNRSGLESMREFLYRESDCHGPTPIWAAGDVFGHYFRCLAQDPGL